MPRQYHIWTPQERQFIKNNPHLKDAEIAHTLSQMSKYNIKVKHVRTQRYHLGIIKQNGRGLSLLKDNICTLTRWEVVKLKKDKYVRGTIKMSGHPLNNKEYLTKAIISTNEKKRVITTMCGIYRLDQTGNDEGLWK